MSSKTMISKYVLNILLQIFLLILFVPGLVLAQKSIDSTRSQRDVEVVRTVLMEYFKEANPDKKLYRVATQRGDVNHFPGYGLLISSPVYTTSWGWKTENGTNFHYKFNLDLSEEDDIEEDNEETTKPKTSVKLLEKEQIITIMKGFLSNYGNLLGFIQPNEKIIFYYDKKYEFNRKINYQDDKANKLVLPERILLEFTQEDTKLSGQELVNKVKISAVSADKTGKSEYEIMGKIFNTTFGNSLEKPFVSSDNSIVYFNGLEKSTSIDRFELFKGLGVIYNFSVNYNRSFKMNSISVISRDKNKPAMTITAENIAIVEPAKEKENDKKKSKKVEKSSEKTQNVGIGSSEDIEKNNVRQGRTEDYKNFLTDVKKYMIEYGRTLRSLEPNERLILNITINSWSKETFPQKIELSVSKNVLDEYDKQSLSLMEAITKITLRERKNNNSSTDLQRRVYKFQE